MQQPPCKNRHTLPRFRACASLAFVLTGTLGLLLATGCGPVSDLSKESDPKPYKGHSLTIRCPDLALASALTSATRSWADRTGATVAIRTEAMTQDDDSDIGILSVPEFGTWADRGELVRVPVSIRTDTSYQLAGVLPAYREQLIEWGGQAQAIPLAGDGSVIVYRTDRLNDTKFIEKFQTLFGHKPTVPSTWEEFAELAIAFREISGKPSLAPLSGPGTADLFFRVAACYDRSAVSDPKAKQGPALSFLFDLATGDSRLNTPGFVAAAKWLARLGEKQCFPPLPPMDSAADPISALADGRERSEL